MPRKLTLEQVLVLEARSQADTLFSEQWRPQTPAQYNFLRCPAQFVLFGGAAGSTKSESLLVDAARYWWHPRATSLILRRTYPELQQLMDRAQILFHDHWRFNDQKKLGRFRSGARIFFGHCNHDKDIFKYWGNEYDFIGVDESTMFTEKPLRLLINSRLRSSDEYLREHLRVRFATNPGSEGHFFHQSIFMGNGCSHCKEGHEGVRLPFDIYHDARWPSDNRPINMSTCFIPGRLSDHQMLGEQYNKMLEGLPASYAKALKEGCWDLFVGQYFDCWNRERMVVHRQTVRNEWWWTYWIGADYGFSGSAAVAHLFAKGPSGVVYVIGEIALKRCPAKDFGKAIKEQWIDPYPQRRLLMGYLSPDAWERDGGDGHTIADQVAEGSGFTWEKASNNRVSGAQLCYTALDQNEMKICDTCELLIAALPSRVHDEDKNPDDVKKVKDDPRDDAYDSWRYGYYSWIGPAEKPDSVKIYESVTSSDPTQAVIQYRQAQQRLKKGDAAVSYRGIAPWKDSS